jgi:hypothetical protein
MVLVFQGRPAGDVFLFLSVGRRFWAGVHQDLRLLPVPIKVWLNGHEWANGKRPRRGSGSASCPTGSPPVRNPAALQAICDRLGPGTIGVFFERWMSRLPLPLTEHDRAAGYWWELSMRQVEVSRTLVLDAPRQDCGFFDALVADNLDIGRPDQVELVFTGKHERRGRPRTQPLTFKTKIVTRGTGVTVNAFYKNSRIKQYLKGGRALRIETVINSPDDLRCHRRLVPSTSCRPARVRSIGACSILNVSVRAASLRVQPLSGSHGPPSPRMAGGPRPYGSATLGFKPWPAPYAPACSPSPASPTRACAP